jgi:hypothetical protein
MSNLKERKLKAINFQIQEIENNPGYWKNYWLQIVLIGVFVTFITPEYTHKGLKPLIFHFNYNYPFCYSFVAIIYATTCAVMLVTFGIQDKKKLKRLKKERELVSFFRN